MSDKRVLQIREPYLVFLGDVVEAQDAKTGLGLAEWKRQSCIGQLRLTPGTCSAGLPDMSIVQAAAAGARSLVVGVAPFGGSLMESWLSAFEEAAIAGLDIVSGLHVQVASIPLLRRAARRGGGRLIDVRVPPEEIPVGAGRKRSGLRLLTVGTDCALGKKYTALTIAKELQSRGLAAHFRASGQTGIMIAGEGIPIDSVVADFISGAAEMLSPDADMEHWDIIEGQGSLFHPAYAGVSLGLLHGSQPDAIVLCHEPGRQHINGYPNYPIPEISECIRMHIQLGRLTNPGIRCVGVSLNTSEMGAKDASTYKSQLSAFLRLPCIDPIQDGAGLIVDNLVNEFSRRTV